MGTQINTVKNVQFLKMNMKLPLVVILGATGSGKTKLSIDLARRFGGEIIGADSIQIYKGMDIISAKPTADERSKVKHHLIDILHPHETSTVIDYRNRALKIINELISKNFLPIIVGGTNYYIESLLWKILVEDPEIDNVIPYKSAKDYEQSSLELHDKLKLLDPGMARRLHPNNKRKILRSLEVLEQKGRQHSDLLKEQQVSAGGSSFGGGLRFQNTIIFWLQWDQPVLDNRIYSRVDTMMEDGLVDELLNFHKLYNEHRITNESKPNYTRGIFQMIGLKEFHEYLILDDNERNSENGKIKLEKGIESLKMVTRRYAKKQIRWINNRLLGNTDREVPPVYGLSTDNLNNWYKEITTPAISIINSFINSEKCRFEPLPKIPIKSKPNSQDDTNFCEVCQRIFVGEHQWQAHVSSSKHKRMKTKRKKFEKIETNSKI